MMMMMMSSRPQHFLLVWSSSVCLTVSNSWPSGLPWLWLWMLVYYLRQTCACLGLSFAA